MCLNCHNTIKESLGPLVLAHVVGTIQMTWDVESDVKSEIRAK